MEKVYDIKSVKIAKGYLVLLIGNQKFKFPLSEVSGKLSKASEAELNDFKVSPSGYGIHWRLIDEDISINGLLKK